MKTILIKICQIGLRLYLMDIENFDGEATYEDVKEHLHWWGKFGFNISEFATKAYFAIK